MSASLREVGNPSVNAQLTMAVKAGRIEGRLIKKTWDMRGSRLQDLCGDDCSTSITSDPEVMDHESNGVAVGK